MSKPIDRITPEQMLERAASGVAKVDQLGPRGTTLCTMNEIEAMAMVIAASGVLPGYAHEPKTQPTHNTKETKE